MNTGMWENQATQANRQTLIDRDIELYGPGAGELACGESGEGRMLEPEEIVQRIEGHSPTGPLQNRTALITAGPTREPIDPVRYITNRSSGKMGYALAQALQKAGASVILVSGPVNIPAPPEVQHIGVETSLQMHSAVFNALDENSVDLFIACAAVADYRPESVADQKIKKQNQTTTLSLTPNPDILADVSALEPTQRPFCVGFAAETERVAIQGEEKRKRKGVDMLAANLVGAENGGFEDDNNSLTVLWENGGSELPFLPKTELAEALTELIVERFQDSEASHAHSSPSQTSN